VPGGTNGFGIDAARTYHPDRGSHIGIDTTATASTIWYPGAVPDPVRRSHFVPQAGPAEVYAVVVDFPAYPRLFPEFRGVRVLETEGNRMRVEFTAQVVIAARYVLDLVCDAQALTVEWTYVEGEVVTNSVGSWRFAPQGQGTRIDYAAAIEVRAPVPGFILRKITDALVSASLPAMFSAITREVARRQASGPSSSR
jgi:ribosome-associated toxin RatA of RatAB toxin-antitoxin module